MRIVVCEDEERDRTLLVSCLKQALEQRKVSAEVLAYTNGETLLEELGQIKGQIYFLDIFMSAISGVTVAKTIRGTDKDAAIVFITSSSDHYADGFAVGAVHYLLKPFTQDQIDEALDRCLRQVGDLERYINLIINREKRRILLSDILWVESKDKVCCLHLHSGQYRSYLHLDDLEGRLDDPRFLRCHRSFLINMDEVDKMDNGYFYMTDKAEIPVRQTQKNYFRIVYEDYLFEKMRRRQ